MQKRKARNPYDPLFLTLVVLLFIYVIARAVLIDMTHDEAYSFYNVKHFWYVETLCTGNTHWFNFAAIKLAVLLGLEKASQLRWFTIISASVFLMVGYCWIRSVKDVASKCLIFSLLFLNPYLIDYFSLARGYAAGLMFEGLSILFLVLAFSKTERKFSFLALTFAGMSAIANFNFFYFFAAFCLVYFFTFYFKNGFIFFKDKDFYLDVLYALGIMALVLRALLFVTECSNDIGAYGGVSFIHSLFSGYVDGFIYKKFILSSSAFSIALYGIFALVLLALGYGIKYSSKHQNKLYTHVSIITGLMFVLCMVTKVAFKVLYPVDRTTLMFFPLFAVLIVCFLMEVIKDGLVKRILFFAISLVFGLNFLWSINFTAPLDYTEQSDAKECFEYLDKLGAKKVGIAPELYGVFRNYYQQTDKYHFSFIGESINTSIPVGIDTEANKLAEFEYLVMFPPYNISFYKENQISFDPLIFYKDTRVLIVKVLVK